MDIKNVSWLRTLRLLKMMKMLRVVRAMKLFQELRIILNCIAGGMRAFVWSLVLLKLMNYMVALVLMQGVSSFLESHPYDTLDVTLRNDLNELFATVWKSMMTLYRPVACGGPWKHTAIVLWDVGPLYYTVFIAYMSFVSFAVLKLLTGIFVEQAKDCANMDREHVIREQMLERKAMIKELQSLFYNMDDDESGLLTWEEFATHLEDETVVEYLRSMDLEASDAESLFRLIDKDAGGEVSVDEFVNGAQRLRGPSKCSDVMAIASDINRISMMVTVLSDFVEEKLDKPSQIGNPSQRSLTTRLMEQRESRKKQKNKSPEQIVSEAAAGKS